MRAQGVQGPAGKAKMGMGVVLGAAGVGVCLCDCFVSVWIYLSALGLGLGLARGCRTVGYCRNATGGMVGSSFSWLREVRKEGRMSYMGRLFILSNSIVFCSLPLCSCFLPF